MWKEIGKLFSSVLKLSQNTVRNSEEIKALREDVKNLTDVVLKLKHEINYLKDTRHEDRDIILGRVQNLLLKHENKDLRDLLVMERESTDKAKHIST